MSTTHTPEPWYTDSNRYVDYIYSGAEKVCQFFDRDLDDFENKVANAKRIVECVNAMEGIESPQKLRETWEVVKELELDAYHKLKAERDELKAESLTKDQQISELLDALEKASGYVSYVEKPNFEAIIKKYKS